jgi:hypothetical protein
VTAREPFETAVAHARALDDWIEAEAIVATLRRAVAIAAERAAERARDATMLLRAGRGDAFAVGVADAAQILAERAAAEERRLEAALRAEALLRERLVAARSALVESHAGPGDDVERSAACG